MIGRWTRRWRALRRWLSRSEWLARLLRLPATDAPPDAPGLVLVQIDGLSHGELQRALARGEMPFLQRLLTREDYRLRPLYAGLPSTTAACQGELFYGVPAAVPAFGFRDHRSGRVVRMIEPAAAAAVERELAARGGEPLLAGGSCYVDNYTGGAAEPHFCPSALGWGPALRAANPLVVALFALANLGSFLRLLVLLVVELGLAVVDFVRGLVAGEDLGHELRFIPTRVAIAILLRELAEIGARIDIARGLPIIHLNFLGYDEQAHRRGPDSLFAHWTLKGIDAAIGRLWRAAQRSGRRHYELWVHADHGQERVRPWPRAHGRPLPDSVGALCRRHGVTVRVAVPPDATGVQTQRVRQLGGRRIQRLLPVRAGRPGGEEDDGLTVVTPGPVAFAYCAEPLPAALRERLGQALAAEAGVPLVLAAESGGRARAWTADGAFTLPGDAARVLGRDHPWRAAAARDLAALAHHPDAGQFVLCGWRAGHEAVSFPVENGAHGGAGPHETSAFVLLPADAPWRPADPAAPRHRDLREAALRHLGRLAGPARGGPAGGGEGGTLRLLTYNVHSCIGMDGRLSPERIARLIARLAPDVVALQEVDVGRPRTGAVDQAHRIAELLAMDVHFHASLQVAEERYGNAVLSRLPMRRVRAGALPGLPGLEPRGVLWVAIQWGDGELHVFNTHLGLRARERRAQVEALLGPDWLGHPDCRGPVVLCGDFNTLPGAREYRRLRQRLRDAQRELAGHRPRGTFFGRWPALRLDHVFIGGGLRVVDVEVPGSELARVASDHLPLLVELARTG